MALGALRFPISPAQDLTADNSSALALQGCDKKRNENWTERTSVTVWQMRHGVWWLKGKAAILFPPYTYLGRLRFSTPWTSQRFGGKWLWSVVERLIVFWLQKTPFDMGDAVRRMHTNGTQPLQGRNLANYLGCFVWVNWFFFPYQCKPFDSLGIRKGMKITLIFCCPSNGDESHELIKTSALWEFILFHSFQNKQKPLLTLPLVRYGNVLRRFPLASEENGKKRELL